MEDKEAPNSAFTMSIKGMAMLTVCSVFSLRNLPSIAEYGWNIIFFLSAARTDAPEIEQRTTI